MMNQEQLEAHWRNFSFDWDMFMEGAAYETVPNLKPWQLLEIKNNAWHSYVADALVTKEAL